MLRVTGGELRGRRLANARGLALRPTTGMIREALFNIIGPAVEGAVFLDICAGCGAVGIEALSRGAALAVLVDRHPSAAALVRRNLEAFGLSSRAEVLRADALRALLALARRGAAADLAFIDPPYESDVIERCLPSPAWRVIMRGRKRLYLQHRRGALSAVPAVWRLVDQRNFGDTELTTLEGTWTA